MKTQQVNLAQVELIGEPVSFDETPMSPPEGVTGSQIGKLHRFRITTSDTLDHVFGLVIWPNALPEIRSIERIAGLEKYKQLEKNGRLSILVQPNGRWLAQVRALRINPAKGYANLAGVTVEELSELLGADVSAFFVSLGCIGFDTRANLVGDTSKAKGNLAILTEADNIMAMASMFALTRVMALMFDRGAAE